MRFQFLASFDKSVKKRSNERANKVKQTLIKFLDFYETGIRPEGLGLKKLYKNF